MEIRVLPDANIWASATLHSWFGVMATESWGLWSFSWTEDIMAEAVRARRRRFPRSHSRQIEDVRDRLLPVLGKNKITNYPHDDSVLWYPDIGDAHVHSAAVAAGIDEIVSDNARDFRGICSGLVSRSYRVYTADEWLMRAGHHAPGVVDRVIHAQWRYWMRRGRASELCERLLRAGCPRFSCYVESRLPMPSSGCNGPG
ncbi:PIN domain-containing protein [Corynebacterium mastitidis]|uniref:PIN domain-containing protein n=1 Tax=Corynebacterium mastitidis TaxID=161890 RepID=UPI00254C5310|nr:PIN domain-containing protein [Corynebacterium mastitidis]MDK8450933.1 hypothetical protein [Corynebacterium mastitidis]